MPRVVQCECGFVVRGDSDDQIVPAVQRHAAEAHGLDLSPEQVLAMAVPD